MAETAQTDLTAPKSVRKERRTQVTETQHSLFVLRELVSKDFKLKYRRSVLGILWSVLNPLLMMIVLTAVFSYMFRFAIEHFPVYLILGNTLFALMSASTSDAMRSIMVSAPLIKKVKINKIVFPIEKVIFELVNFCISLIAVALVMAFFRIAPTINLVFLPLLLLYMVLFCSGLGMLLSALVVFFRDIEHLWSVVLTAWTYATPLFYPADLWPDFLARIEVFNPMYHYVTYFRDIALWNTTPSLTLNLACFGFAIITFVVGYIVFRKTEDKFVLHV
ncbi:MAG: ABC transporter permease [Eggerthellaceae bacterium]|nr:ABC transporter permease [Eggerthellaceae bacterium]